jgi:hypothetical protein
MLQPEKNTYSCLAGYRFGGNVTTGKKCTVVGPAMIWQERYNRKKKFTVVWLAIDLARTLQPEKKYSHRAGFYLAGALRLEKKTYSHLAGYRFGGNITTRKKNIQCRRKKKRTVVWLAIDLAGTLQPKKKRTVVRKKIQSKRVLGHIKYTHQLADHNKVTQ